MAGGFDKINALYQKSPQKTVEAVENLTGINIDYYITVKTSALIEIVDAIGGVDFDVPINMDYDDDTQDLHIHLKAGQQKINGEKAEQLVRFRHNNNGTTYSAEYGDNDEGRMMKIPNIIDPSVPIGKDDSENVEVQRFGEPKVPDYEIPYHADIMERLNGLDKESAGRTSGEGFYYLTGDIARIHSAMLSYARTEAKNLFIFFFIILSSYKNPWLLPLIDNFDSAAGIDYEVRE